MPKVGSFNINYNPLVIKDNENKLVVVHIGNKHSFISDKLKSNFKRYMRVTKVPTFNYKYVDYERDTMKPELKEAIAKNHKIPVFLFMSNIIKSPEDSIVIMEHYRTFNEILKKINELNLEIAVKLSKLETKED